MPGDTDERMVLKIATHLGRVHDYVDAKSRQFIRWPDSRDHQKSRRMQRTATEYDLVRHHLATISRHPHNATLINEQAPHRRVQIHAHARGRRTVSPEIGIRA